MSFRIVLLSIPLLGTACLPSPFAGLSNGDKYSCEGACIEGYEVSLPDGRLLDGPPPEATTYGDEPVFRSVRWVDVEPGVAAIEVELEFPTAADRWVLGDFILEVEGRHYAVATVPADDSGTSYGGKPSACESLEQTQGYGCTDACLEACACVRCDDSTIRSNFVGGCATTCTAQDHQGLIGPEPYTSEAVLADRVYNGDAASGLPGMLASVPSCDGSQCAERAAAQRRETARRRLLVNFGNSDHLSKLDFGTLMAPAEPPHDYVPPAGAPFEKGTVRVSECGLCQTAL